MSAEHQTSLKFRHVRCSESGGEEYADKRCGATWQFTIDCHNKEWSFLMNSITANDRHGCANDIAWQCTCMINIYLIGA